MFDSNGSFLLALLWFFMFAVYLMCLFWIFGDLFRSRDMGGWGKALWVLFIIVAPFLAMLIYVLVRGSGMTERAVDEARRMQSQQMEFAQAVVASQSGSGSTSATEQIASAKALLDSGAITQAEFESLKTKALA